MLIPLLASWVLAQSASPEVPKLALPTAQQVAWADAEVGMFVHFAPNTWQDAEYDQLSTPLEAIDPKALDTNQWVRVAQSMGAGYIVFVAKHVGGFCWWQTETTEYSVKNTPWRGGKGDLMRELAESCRKANMKLGVYLSPADTKHGIEVGGRAETPEKQKEYEQLFRRQLVELLSNYGSMFEVWFDGSLVFDVGDILAQHAPDAVVFQGPQASIRWVGNEDGVAPYPAWNSVKFGARPWGVYTAEDGTPDGDRWLPNECDARIRNTWFWNTRNAPTLKSVEQLMDMYERSVGHGAVLLLNHTPDPTGAIPEADVLRAAEFGAEIRRRYGTSIADIAGPGRKLQLGPSAPRTIDCVITMEDIAQGERVRSYSIEGLTSEGWKELARGTAIGHKKIDRFAPVEVAQVRVLVHEAAAEPIFRRIALHDTRRK